MNREYAVIYAANKLLREVDCMSHICDECPMAIFDEERRFKGCISNILDNRVRELKF